MENLSATQIGKLSLKNPVLTASGTFGYGEEFADFFDLNLLGGFVVKGTTAKPREGNAYPRMAETRMGMLNAVGLQNKGVDYFVHTILPRISKLVDTSVVPAPTRIIVNVSGSTMEDYLEVVQKLCVPEAAAVDAIEVNISCPNVKQGGMAFGTDPCMAAEVVRAIRKIYPKTVIVKLSPNVTSISDIALAVEDAGADAVSLINTLVGMEVDVQRQKPVLSTIYGGFSGPCIKPIALHKVWQVAKAVKIPVIGMGGICNTEDALAFLMVGAKAIQVGSANFVNPKASAEIAAGIDRYLLDKGCSSVSEIIGII